MKKLLLVLLAVVVAVAGYQFFDAVGTQMTLNARVERRLEEVDAPTVERVRQALIRDAGQAGLALTPAQVTIQLEDTDTTSYAQRVAGKTGLAFQNQRVTIVVRYTARVCGWPWPREIRQTKIRQVAVTPPPAQRDAQRVLDSDN